MILPRPVRSALIAAALAAAPAVVAAPDARAAHGDPVVVDLSNHLVPITAGFAGGDVLVFGATEGKGDVIVAVRGPEREEVVRRKARVAGVWMNADEVAFEQVPIYYAVAASAPIEDLLPPAERRRLDIGVDQLNIRPAVVPPPADVADFRAALIRNKQRLGLYAREPGHVIYLGNRLFRTNLHFPANVPTGIYRVDVYLVQDGEVVHRTMTPLAVRKIGVEAEVFSFAHRHSLAYGVVAVLIAVAAGWLASVAFRKA